MDDYIEEKIGELFRQEDRRNDEHYPDVPTDDMPEEVANAVKRFKSMDKDERDHQILLYWLLGGDPTPPYKMSKEESDYQDEPKGDSYCGNCEYAYYSNETGKLICSQIRGKVDWEGWCKLWEHVEPDPVLEDHYEK